MDSYFREDLNHRQHKEMLIIHCNGLVLDVQKKWRKWITCCFAVRLQAPCGMISLGEMG